MCWCILRDDSGVNYTTITAMENSYANASDNSVYLASDGVTYSDESSYNYHIVTDNNSLIKNKGYSINYNGIYDQAFALYDIDDESRPTDYSNIDLGADEFFNQ